MNKATVNRLLNEEHTVTMDGCALLVLTRVLLDAVSRDEELAETLDAGNVTQEDADTLSVRSRMMLSAGAYLAVAAINIFGENYMREIFEDDRNIPVIN
jgi:hypothetical protein